MTTAIEAVRTASKMLEQAGSESAALDAEVIMRHLLGWRRIEYLVRRNEPIAAETSAAYAALIARRVRREPVAYIIGEREFLGLTFAVGPGVLVPRPETETLVEWAARWLTGKYDRIAVDVGTGSGAIAIGLASIVRADELRQIIAIDPSDDALDWARRNAASLAPTAPISFIRGSLLDSIDAPVDLVLANLPYLTPDQTDENPDLAAEPRSALVSGSDGLDLILELLADLPRVLSPAGAAILELDTSQATTVARMATQAFPDAIVSILTDLSSRDRFVTIERQS